MSGGTLFAAIQAIKQSEVLGSGVMSSPWNSPLFFLLIILLVKVWLAFKVRDWAAGRGRTNRAWFICALLFLIPTVIVLVLMPKLPVIKMQHSSQHKIDLSAPEAD
jgi:hypothetical protein